MYQCEQCNKNYSRKDSLKRHLDNTHLQSKEILSKKIKLANESTTQMKYCEVCEKEIDANKFLGHLRSNNHKDKLLSDSEGSIKKIASAFKSRLVSFRIVCDFENPNIEGFFNEKKCDVIKLLNDYIESHTSIKANLELFALYKKGVLSDDEEEDIVKEIKSFNTKNKIITKGSHLDEIFIELQREIIRKSEEFQERDSGWSLDKPLYLELNINKYNALNGSSFIDLPPKIKATKGVINIQNHDNMCFAWAVTAALYPAKNNPHRMTSYPNYKDVLNLGNIVFPICLKDIKKFEELNNLSINVYGLEKNTVVGPLYFTENKKDKHINLLYIEDSSKGHYCLIKNLSRLVYSSINKHHSSKMICDGCLLFFENKDKLKDHQLIGCNKTYTIMPEISKNNLKFSNFKNQLEVPFVIYADFESVLKPISTCEDNNNTSFTHQTHVHEPFSFAYYVKCSFDSSKSKFELYRGSDCVKVFMDKIKKEAEDISLILNKSIPMKPLTELEENNFISSNVCHICKQEMGDDKVRDHDHLTGLFRGAAHTECNLKYQTAKFIPVVIHNLTGYDSHFIIKELLNEKVEVLANSMEKYISFTRQIKTINNSIVKVRFIDSNRFLQASLDHLAQILEDHQFECVHEFFNSEEKFKLMRQKGIFPYEYVSDLEKLNDKCLPPKESFSSSLNNVEITEDEYERAQKIWKHFDIQDLGEYSDLYLKTDVLLLVDIFENFRKVCMKTYGLDPGHYFTLPGFSWDAMLKITKVELELLVDINMFNFIKKSIRGGLCHSIKKFSEANNKYMKSYDSTKESKYIIYLDANNLYGWAMSEYLPIRNFKWLEKDDIEKFQVKNIEDSNNKGYILEVDLVYPENLHTSHNDLPFCPETITSPYKDSKDVKLIANLSNKSHYVLHYRNLKQCLENGLKLEKIHRILEFDQEPWLKSYIDYNNTFRTNAKTKFEKKTVLN